MKNLTKKEISEKLIVTKRSGFNRGFDYNACVRGFNFETLTDQTPGELMECDGTGHLTFVETCNNKKEVVNAIFNWFKENASHNFDY